MARLTKRGHIFDLALSNDEFNIIKNCMNEALEALKGDFVMRVGATREEAIALLEFLISERKKLRST